MESIQFLTDTEFIQSETCYISGNVIMQISRQQYINYLILWIFSFSSEHSYNSNTHHRYFNISLWALSQSETLSESCLPSMECLGTFTYIVVLSTFHSHTCLRQSKIFCYLKILYMHILGFDHFQLQVLPLVYPTKSSYFFSF